MSALSKYEIRRQPKPFRNALIVLVAVIGAVVLSSIYQYQATKGAILQIKALKQQNRELLIKNEQLIRNDQARMEKREFWAIQQATNKQLQQQVARLQHNIVLLKKELLFYQGVIQGNGNSKLQFRKLHLHTDPEQPNKVAYRLAVTQGKRINKPITGTVTIMLNTKGEQLVVGKHALELEHVQMLSGQIEVTEKIPSSITVSLRQHNKQILSKTFNWQL